MAKKTFAFMRCNLCSLKAHRKEAKKKGMECSVRESGFRESALGKPADVYIHPKSVHIPLTYKHNVYIPRIDFMELAFLEEERPERWLVAWYPDVPKECKCKKLEKTV
jgi:hypothetical protein